MFINIIKKIKIFIGVAFAIFLGILFVNHYKNNNDNKDILTTFPHTKSPLYSKCPRIKQSDEKVELNGTLFYYYENSIWELSGTTSPIKLLDLPQINPSWLFFVPNTSFIIHFHYGEEDNTGTYYIYDLEKPTQNVLPTQGNSGIFDSVETDGKIRFIDNIQEISKEQQIREYLLLDPITQSIVTITQPLHLPDYTSYYEPQEIGYISVGPSRSKMLYTYSDSQYVLKVALQDMEKGGVIQTFTDTSFTPGLPIPTPFWHPTNTTALFSLPIRENEGEVFMKIFYISVITGEFIPLPKQPFPLTNTYPITKVSMSPDEAYLFYQLGFTAGNKPIAFIVDTINSSTGEICTYDEDFISGSWLSPETFLYQTKNKENKYNLYLLNLKSWTVTSLNLDASLYGIKGRE